MGLGQTTSSYCLGKQLKSEVSNQSKKHRMLHAIIENNNEFSIRNHVRNFGNPSLQRDLTFLVQTRVLPRQANSYNGYSQRLPRQ